MGGPRSRNVRLQREAEVLDRRAGPGTGAQVQMGPRCCAAALLQPPGFQRPSPEGPPGRPRAALTSEPAASRSAPRSVTGS